MDVAKTWGEVMQLPFEKILEIGGRILEKVIPDKAAREAAQLELLKLAQAGEFKQIDADVTMATAQTDINKIEAANSNLFVSGWRPAMGWTCVAIFCSNYIGVPLLAWASPMFNIPPPPRLDIGEVLPVLLGMLGLGTLRSMDKKNGAA
jgi:hypothetical protein